LADQRKERLEVLRALARKRRVAHSSQQRQEEVDQWQRQMQYSNDRDSYHRITFSYKLDIQYNISCKFIQFGKMDKVCLHYTAIKIKREARECVARAEK